MSLATRARSSETELAAHWTAAPAERAQAADRLRAAAVSRSFVLRAELEAAGRASRLLFEAQRWHVTSPRPVARGPKTPEEALRRFAAALEERDLDALLQLLGEPLKSLIERELADRLAGLRSAAGQSVAIEGDHAQIQYGARHHIDLRRESGQWEVIDFN